MAGLGEAMGLRLPLLWLCVWICLRKPFMLPLVSAVVLGGFCMQGGLGSLILGDKQHSRWDSRGEEETQEGPS